MLVLTRKVGQAVLIDNDAVRVIVLSVHGKHVRLGIEADPSIPVDREEILPKRMATQERINAPPGNTE